VFWRQDTPWVLLRAHSGKVYSLPWHWTDLPEPVALPSDAAEWTCPVLLAPQTLVELVRFVSYRAGHQRSVSTRKKG